MAVKLVSESVGTKTATFDDFWERYPKRVGKPVAKAKWDAITGDGLKTRTLDRDSGTYISIELTATPEELVAGAERYALSQMDPHTNRIRDGGKYVAHPSTWLNQGRWLDEPEMPTPRTSWQEDAIRGLEQDLGIHDDSSSKTGRSFTR